MRRLIALFALSLSLAFASSAQAQTEPATAAQTQVGMPTQNNAPLFSDPVRQPSEVTPHALALRARWVTVPGWSIGAFLDAHTQLNDGWSVGLEYLYRRAGFDVVLSVD